MPKDHAAHVTAALDETPGEPPVILHQARGAVRLFGRSGHPGETCQATMRSFKVSSVLCNCARQDAMGMHAYIVSSQAGREAGPHCRHDDDQYRLQCQGGIRGLIDASTLPTQGLCAHLRAPPAL